VTTIRLTCMHCSRIPTERLELLSYECAHCGARLSMVYPEATSFSALLQPDLAAPWRYGALLPVDLPLPQAEAKPVVSRSRALEEQLSVEEVWLIDGTTLGTGTFKDYEATVVMAMASELELGRVSVHSTGNTALAYRHYGQQFGVGCAAVVPLRNLDKLGGAHGSDDFPIVAIDAEYPYVSASAKAVAKKQGWQHLAPMRWKLEGKAAFAWLIHEHCPQIDTIVQTIAGGYGPLGLEVGFGRLAELGQKSSVLQKRSYLLFQPADADGLSRAWNSGVEHVDLDDLDLPTDPFEPTLQSTNPVATLPELRRELPADTRISDVTAAVVAQERARIDQLLAANGVELSYEREKSTYIALAGLLSQELDPSMKLGIVVTGSRSFSGTGPTSGWVAAEDLG
jgi:hypothetical protein